MPVTDELSVFDSIQTMEVTTGNPATVNDAAAKNPLGALLHYQGKTYRYVKFDNGTANLASAAAGVAYWKSLVPTTSTYTVTSDQSDASSVGSYNAVAGIFGGIVTDGYYCFIQVGGVATAKTTTATASGDHCVGQTSTTSTDMIFGLVALSVSAITASIKKVIFGTAIAARSNAAHTNTVLLRNLDW
jgi:hypothetical protein